MNLRKPEDIGSVYQQWGCVPYGQQQEELQVHLRYPSIHNRPSMWLPLTSQSHGVSEQRPAPSTQVAATPELS